MNKPVILVSSVTYAIKGKDLLNRNGFMAAIHRVSRTRETGCGYGIYVPQRTEEAQRLLEESGMRILGRADRGNGG